MADVCLVIIGNISLERNVDINNMYAWCASGFRFSSVETGVLVVQGMNNVP